MAMSQQGTVRTVTKTPYLDTVSAKVLRRLKLIAISFLALFVMMTTAISYGLYLQVEEAHAQLARQHEHAEVQRQITCRLIIGQREVLGALADQNRLLGLPTDFQLPILPEECAGIEG